MCICSPSYLLTAVGNEVCTLTAAALSTEPHVQDVYLPIYFVSDKPVYWAQQT